MGMNMLLNILKENRKGKLTPNCKKQYNNAYIEYKKSKTIKIYFKKRKFINNVDTVAVRHAIQ